MTLKFNNNNEKENDMENEIKVLKLITGEELITRITEGQNGTIFLESPMVVQQVQPDASGKVGVALVSWSFAGKTKRVTLETKHVVVILESTSVMITNYLSAISYKESLEREAAEKPTNIINN